MARTESTMVQLGTTAPSFTLPDVLSGRMISRDDLLVDAANARASEGAPGVAARSSTRKAGLLVMFVCVHCPYVKHVEEQLGLLGRDYFGHDGEGPVAIVAIQSNDLTQYPQDGHEGMRTQAVRCGWTFPYLLDETQQVAQHFNAACTPDFFLFDAALRLVYRGQLDGSRPRRGDSGNDEPVTGRDLRAALDAVVNGNAPDPDQRQSIGCNIKWRTAAAS